MMNRTVSECVETDKKEDATIHIFDKLMFENEKLRSENDDLKRSLRARCCDVDDANAVIGYLKKKLKVDFVCDKTDGVCVIGPEMYIKPLRKLFAAIEEMEDK